MTTHASLILHELLLIDTSRFGRKQYPILISATNVPELNEIASLDGGIEVGSAVPLTTLWESLEHTNKYLANEKQEHKTRRHAQSLWIDFRIGGGCAI